MGGADGERRSSVASAKCVWIAARSEPLPAMSTKVDGARRVEPVDLVVGDHVVVEAEALDEDCGCAARSGRRSGGRRARRGSARGRSTSSTMRW